jgi:RNA-directed DNA polymerase
MTKPPISLQDLRRKLYVKAKAEPSWRFWGLYVHGYRPKRSAHDAIERVSNAIVQGKTYVIDLDLRAYFDTVSHSLVLDKVAQRVGDDAILRLLKLMLKASGKCGVAQGGVISPLLSNLYLTEVDKMLERMKRITAHGSWAVLIDGHPRQRGLRSVVEQRLRRELAKLRLEVNEDKTRRVDLTQGQCFAFLGFLFRRIRSRQGRWMPLRLPQIKKRTALLRKLKAIFRRFVSQPVEWVIAQINPILRGWVNYFAFGNSSRCFAYVRQWVDKKIRRHLARSSKRQGVGWKRWSRRWLYDMLGLFDAYRVVLSTSVAESAPSS